MLKAIFAAALVSMPTLSFAADTPTQFVAECSFWPDGSPSLDRESHAATGSTPQEALSGLRHAMGKYVAMMDANKCVRFEGEGVPSVIQTHHPPLAKPHSTSFRALGETNAADVVDARRGASSDNSFVWVPAADVTTIKCTVQK